VDSRIAGIQADPQKYNDVWAQNSIDHQSTGQGGVPTMEFNGEPFFGQDRSTCSSGACARTA
jgi:2-hydroxychromene-2-carboxylate isomerase